MHDCNPRQICLSESSLNPLVADGSNAGASELAVKHDFYKTHLIGTKKSATIAGNASMSPFAKSRFTRQDGAATAHSSVLRAVSKPFRQMLTAEMSEGRDF